MEAPVNRETARPGCFAAAHGSTARGVVVRRAGAGATLAFAMTTWDYGWPGQATSKGAMKIEPGG